MSTKDVYKRRERCAGIGLRSLSVVWIEANYAMDRNLVLMHLALTVVEPALGIGCRLIICARKQEGMFASNNSKEEIDKNL